MPNDTSRATQFFQQISTSSDPAAFLHSLVKDHRCENDFLEFKGAGRIQPKQAKEYWSQALSGFANTEGGVLIWGIRANRIPSPHDSSRKIDAADCLDLVPDPLGFMQTLKDVKLEATVHPVGGVELARWDGGQGDGSGFVVCLIPEGGNKPYRAELDPTKQYYQRIGDSFTVIPHSLLASLFYPRSTPNLQLALTFVEVSQLTNEGHPRDRKSAYVFESYLTNDGSGSAYDVLITVKTNYPAEWAEQESFSSADQTRPQNRRTFLATRPIHPDEEPLRCLRCRVEAPTFLYFQSTGRKDIADPQRIVFDIGMYVRDAEPVRSVMAFGKDDISEGATKTTATDQP